MQKDSMDKVWNSLGQASRSVIILCACGVCGVFVCDCVQSALGYEHQTDLSKHGSQKDGAKGFGGKYGVEKDNQDKVWCGYVHTVC